MDKYVYNFDEGSKEDKALLGGKGANLAEMTKIGLPVPPGFTITTNACKKYYEYKNGLWEELILQLKRHLALLELRTGKKFGDHDNPLLVSVRSGSVVSMPGMMDTILNLGLNDESVIGLADATHNLRFAYDSYRRFIQMFSDVVMEIPKYKFERILERVKQSKGYKLDVELTSSDLMDLVKEYKQLYLNEKHLQFPNDPYEQLYLAIEAVFKSWNNHRAIIYRKLNDISDSLGTAVNVQSMVFGNMGDRSGTGVAFTRNPSNGENTLFGEFLVNAQGEDVVAGIRTPSSIQELKDIMPHVYDQFVDVTLKLENHYKDMQDIEFTIENEKLYFLQTRTGKRTAKAAINIAVDLVNEGKITKEEAILRIDAKQFDQLLHPVFEEKALKEATLLCTGLPASPGACSGRIVFNAADVIKAKENHEKVILVRTETSPEDIEGMAYAAGILTSRGGMTSHAAVVARGMGKCCVAGCGELIVDEEKKTFRIRNTYVKEGEFISLDGSTGRVYIGNIPYVDPEISGKFELFMSWVNDIKRLKVRTNADTPKDALMGVRFGAEGIGLCRTEHMFFDESRIPIVRKMIIAKTLEERLEALHALLPLQRQDFYEIFKAMEERPCNIRLLDPPLHEFLPKKDIDMIVLAKDMGLTLEEIKTRVEDLAECNPMLGHRGCRLAITYPEIYNMQAKAIIEAAILIKQENKDVTVEIMIPLVGDELELKYIKSNIIKVIEDTCREKNCPIDYKIGTMIEVPRAALLADEIAKEAAFFSFGTNDLTQMTFGFSRDDSNKFLKEYETKMLIEKDPFQTIDQNGVGKLIKMAIGLGKTTNPGLKIGICGEHGGDPKSVEFCDGLGLDYVSCSPFRVPVARLSAAQAVLKKYS